MSRYASNQDVVRFFASHGIEVTRVRREGQVRHLCVNSRALTLPMDADPDECLRRVREGMATSEQPDETGNSGVA
ncbi:MAG: hypothetical protein J0L73_11055 [Verrucomicrobia bacterium]|nr:hypothetical protein [Verrucomicrobiota bacterium]